MNNIIKGVLYSISYFSTLPVKLKYFDANDQFYKGVVVGLPIVGFIIGLLLVILNIILPYPAIYNSIVVSILYPFFYGFIHLEAVGDTIDAYFSSFGKKDTYSIIKEPQIGSIGAVGMFSFLILKILALSYLLYLEQYFIIIFTMILSRGSIYFTLDLEYHKKSSFIRSLQQSIKPNMIIKLIFLPVSLLSKSIQTYLQKKIGFINGDTLGFSIELQEIIYLNIGLMFVV